MVLPLNVTDRDRLCLVCPVPDDCDPGHELCLCSGGATPALTLAAHVLAALDLWAEGLREDALATVERGIQLTQDGGDRPTVAVPPKRRSSLDWRLTQRLRGGPVTTLQLRQAMPGVPRTTLTNALHRLAKRGDLVRLARGVYALPADES